MIMHVVGANAQIQFNPSLPDGTPRKAFGRGNLLAMGWRPTISFEQGLRGSMLGI
jgi:GDP-L-fucose synthase